MRSLLHDGFSAGAENVGGCRRARVISRVLGLGAHLHALLLAKKINVTDKNVLVTISGGNVDDKNFQEYLKLAEDQK